MTDEQDVIFTWKTRRQWKKQKIQFSPHVALGSRLQPLLPEELEKQPGWGESGQGKQLVWGKKGPKSQFRISVKEEPQWNTRSLHLAWKVEKDGRIIFITLCELTPARKVEWAEAKEKR